MTWQHTIYPTAWGDKGYIVVAYRDGKVSLTFDSWDGLPTATYELEAAVGLNLRDALHIAV